MNYAFLGEKPLKMGGVVSSKGKIPLGKRILCFKITLQTFISSLFDFKSLKFCVE